MVLNMNYHLLFEDAPSPLNIPSYQNSYYPEIESESTMMQLMVEFNNEVLESRSFLSTLYQTEALNESMSSANIINGIHNVLIKIKKAIINVFTSILHFFQKIIQNIREKIATKKDIVESKYGYHERMKILDKILKSTPPAEKTIRITNIQATEDLLDKSFPDVSIISSDLVRMATDTMNNYCTNIVQKDGADASLLDDAEVKASESFVNYIEGQKDFMLSKVFGKYSYDSTAITKSANDIANKAFGSNEPSDVVLTTDLYGLACDNLDKGKDILRDIDKLYNDTEKSYKAIVAEMDTVSKSVDYLSKVAVEYKSPFKQRYYDATNTIVERVNRVLNIIQEIVNANFVLLTKKSTRIHTIYGNSNIGSAEVKRICHKMIATVLDINDPKLQTDNSAISGLEFAQEARDIQNEFDSFALLAEEALIENSFNSTMYTSLLEADGDTTDNNQQPQATETTANSDQASANKNTAEAQGKKNAIMQFIETIIAKLGDALKRFKDRFNALIVKTDLPWWKDNRENIRNKTLTSTKVNQFFKYNLDLFNNSTFVPFDVTSDELSSNEKLQEAIIKKITSNPPIFNEKDETSFSQKLMKIYEGEYINDENGDGKALNEIGYNHDTVYTFIDNFITKGFSSDSLKTIDDDTKSINDKQKDIKTNYDQYSSQLRQSSTTSNAPEQKAEEQKTEPQNASADISADFKFNLADYFGLVHHEASFKVEGDDSQYAGTSNGGNASNKELDERIKRWVNYNTTAITTRMTAVLAAYKQYMSLFKAVYKGKTSENTENK